jgi:ArsR family transcriptional regulator
MVELANLSALFKAVGEPIRLRLLHLLCRAELSVSDLVEILAMPQSTISRHLKALKEQGLAADRPEGVATFYHASLEAELGNGETPVRDALMAILRDSPLPPADQQRLERTLALREAPGEDFFDRLGHRWDALREACFGPTLHFEALLHLLPTEWTVADLGTGTGYLLPYLGAQFRQVIAIDQSEPMLGLAGRAVAQAGLANVELRLGKLEALPLADGEIDLALSLLILHHLAQPEQALREIHRALRPGGRLLLVELHPYENEKFRVHMGDRRPGLALSELQAWLGDCGLTFLRAWDFPHTEHPEHELAPLPRMYGVVAERRCPLSKD